MTTRLQIVALDKMAFDEDVDSVSLPGIDGQLGILPRHAPIVTVLAVGSVTARQDGGEIKFSLTGGFAQIASDKVTILADAAERAD